MSEIENGAKGLLTGLLWDQRTELCTVQQLTLATWTYKMGLMLECALIPRRQWSPALRHDLKLFYRDRRPKQEATIWLGRHELLSSWPDMPAFASVAKVRSDSGYDGTLSWLVACYALFAVGRWEAPRRLNVDPAGLGGPAQRTALYLRHSRRRCGRQTNPSSTRTWRPSATRNRMPHSWSPSPLRARRALTTANGPPP